MGSGGDLVKICSKCGSDGPFNKNKRSKDGLSSYCSLCMREADHRSYLRHKEERLKKKCNWRKANREKVKTWKRNWEKENPEKMRAMEERKKPKSNAAARARYAKDPSKKAASHRKWRDAHPEKEKAVRLRRRARKLGARGVSTGEQIAARIEFFGGLCAYCHEAPYEQIDHAIALANGGTNWSANLRPACRTCNDRKGTKTWRFVKLGSVVDGDRATTYLWKLCKNQLKWSNRRFEYAEFEKSRLQYREICFG